MKNPKLLQEKQVVDNLFIQIKGFVIDPYYQSLLSYYLCIRVSGFVENCVRTILTDYSVPRAKYNVRTYVGHSLERLPNPTYDSICELLKKYSDKWADRFKLAITTQVRQSLVSIVVNRNNIAHGGNSNITLNQLEVYYTDILQLIDELEQTCV